MDLSGFEPVRPGDLNTGFYADIKRKKDQPKKKIILIRAPKSIKAADLDGFKLEITGGKQVLSKTFVVEDKTSKTRRSYHMKKDVDKDLAPVALALPHTDHIAIGIQNSFSEIWNLSLVPDAAALPPMTVDLEDDIGGRSWRPVPQATNLRVPLSVMDISMQPAEIKKDAAEKTSVSASPSKKSKKRKNNAE